ncbi:hypothetical protein IWZ01DRAFT_267141 [Phyllosticta capitalensis]
MAVVVFIVSSIASVTLPLSRLFSFGRFAVPGNRRVQKQNAHADAEDNVGKESEVTKASEYRRDGCLAPLPRCTKSYVCHANNENVDGLREALLTHISPTAAW